jgi:hypothetical protein
MNNNELSIPENPCDTCVAKYCESPFNEDGECWQGLENKDVQVQWLQIGLQEELESLKP